MDDKSKVYIFHIGEILLIILLIILLTAFSFTMGYRVGKKHTDKLDGFTTEDQQLAKSADGEVIKSDEEEDVEKKISKLKEKMKAPIVAKVADKTKKATNAIKKAVEEAKPKKVMNSIKEEVKEVKSDTYNALKDAFDKMDKEENAKAEVEASKDENVDKLEEKLAETTKEVKNEVPSETPDKDKDLTQDSLTNYTGKHTIQLGSYKTVEDAKNFASGFKVRGYNPIIYEVDLDSKGTWYRVNLGVFDSVAEAREYIEKEESLFKGTDYVIGVF